MNGEYRNTVDEKGRLMIPPKIREQMGTCDNLMLTKSMDDSLWLFTKEDFEALNRKVNYDPLSIFNENSLMIDRMIISPARSVELDKAGRLSIPQFLRDYAGIDAKSECVILGSMTKVEIMSAKKYDEYVIQCRNLLSNAGNQLSIQRMGQ